MGAARGTTADFVLLPLVFILVLFDSGIWELDGVGRFAPCPSRTQLGRRVGPGDRLLRPGRGDVRRAPVPWPACRWGRTARPAWSQLFAPVAFLEWEFAAAIGNL